MDNFMKILKKQKKWFILGGGILVVFIIFSIVLYMFNHGLVSTDISSIEVPIEESQSVSVETPIEDDKSNLTEEQKKLVEKYSPEMEEMSALFQANTWTTDKDSKTIVFDKYSFKEIAAESEEENTYVIASIDTEKEGSTENKYISVLFGDGTYGLMTFQTIETGGVSSNGGGEVAKTKKSISYGISCNKFKNAKFYTRIAPSKKFEVIDLDETINQFIGNNQEQLQTELQEYCSLRYPTASKAIWTKTVSINYETGLTILEFELDNSAKTTLNVNYSMTDKKFAMTAK